MLKCVNFFNSLKIADGQVSLNNFNSGLPIQGMRGEGMKSTTIFVSIKFTRFIIYIILMSHVKKQSLELAQNTRSVGMRIDCRYY